MVRPRDVTTSPDPQLSAHSPHFLTGFFWVLTGFFFRVFSRVLSGFFSGFQPGQNQVKFSPTPSMADPLWRSPINKEHLKEFGGRSASESESVPGTFWGRVPGHPGRPDLICV